jgi:hypothetical protein
MPDKAMEGRRKNVIHETLSCRIAIRTEGKLEMMTSRQIVKRCIEFQSPPRIGMSFLTEPIDGRVWDETDFHFVHYAVDPRFLPEPGQEEWTMEWGNRRRRLNGGIGETVYSPLAEGWHLLETYQFPDFSSASRYSHLKDEVAEANAQGKYVVGGIPPQMDQLMELRGMENWYADHVLEKENLCQLLDRIVDIQETIVAYYAEAGVDGVITWDDMGDNNQAFINPAVFREIYLPRYKHLIDRLHDRGMHFIHHCCGQVREYLPMFVEAGCDVLQIDQPELMGTEWLGRHYGGKICFWNPVDIQKTIGSGKLDAIDDEAHRQVWFLGNYDGGFMVKAYSQPETIGMTVAQADRQYQAFKRLARYPLIPYKKIGKETFYG